MSNTIDPIESDTVNNDAPLPKDAAETTNASTVESDPPPTSPSPSTAANIDNENDPSQSSATATNTSTTDINNSNDSTTSITTTTTTAPRRRPNKSGGKKSSRRPTEGGLAIGFTADELKEQAKKRSEWMRADVTERIALRKKVKEEEEKRANSALKIVLFFWALVIFAIFWHVYKTMNHSPDRPYTSVDSFHPLASDGLFRAFKRQQRMM